MNPLLKFRSKDQTIKRLVLTPGEPAGVGVDVLIQAAQQPFEAEIVVVADARLLAARAKLLQYPLELSTFNETLAPIANGSGKIKIIDVPLVVPCTPGKLQVENSAYVLSTLDLAIEHCLNKQCDGMVTGPVHKEIIVKGNIEFTGHTTYLQQKTHSAMSLMSFYTPQMWIALATTHIPLNAVSKALTPELLTQQLTMFYQSLQRYKNNEPPKLLVCGLNPHAGEGGTLGREEVDFIENVLVQLRQPGWIIDGPQPGDTAFIPRHREHYDGIFALYHDQGLAPIKALYFDDIVNVTLGLPFIRTSVSHGTALDLAGSGRANASSMLNAIQLAGKLA
jgi:4-hydroxythreonine-4-phosphate dehydrogenase